MRRNFDPGTRKPLSWPLSKQRMMVCWLTLQILAASPVVKTVFILAEFLTLAANGQTHEFGPPGQPAPGIPGAEIIRDLPLAHPSPIHRAPPTGTDRQRQSDCGRSRAEE